MSLAWVIKLTVTRCISPFGTLLLLSSVTTCNAVNKPHIAVPRSGSGHESPRLSSSATAAADQRTTTCMYAFPANPAEHSGQSDKKSPACSDSLWSACRPQRPWSSASVKRYVELDAKMYFFCKFFTKQNQSSKISRLIVIQPQQLPSPWLFVSCYGQKLFAIFTMSFSDALMETGQSMGTEFTIFWAKIIRYAVWYKTRPWKLTIYYLVNLYASMMQGQSPEGTLTLQGEAKFGLNAFYIPHY